MKYIITMLAICCILNCGIENDNSILRVSDGPVVVNTSSVEQTLSGYEAPYDPSGKYDESDGYPNFAERLMLQLTNRVRCDPANAVYYDCDDNEDEQGNKDTAKIAHCNALREEDKAIPPVIYNRPLSEAARFHAEDMANTQGCFQHESCDGTDPFDRIGRYYSGMASENIAMGNPFYPEQAISGWLTSPGHHENMMELRDFTDPAQKHTELGTGWVESETQPFKYAVQDFGNEVIDVTGIPSGVCWVDITGIKSETGFAYKDFFFEANYYDPTEIAPLAMYAVIDGQCYEMSKVFGSDSNGTYQYSHKFEGDGCHSYYFQGFNQDKYLFQYPSYETSINLVVGHGCEGEIMPHVQVNCMGSDEGGDGEAEDSCACSSIELNSKSSGFNYSVLILLIIAAFIIQFKKLLVIKKESD